MGIKKVGFLFLNVYIIALSSYLKKVVMEKWEIIILEEMKIVN